jgi:hypothetical protein
MMRTLAVLTLAFAAYAGVPQVERKPVPQMKVSFGVFTNAATGCTPIERNVYQCTPDGDLGTLGCDSISRVDELGGLRPQLPIAVCSFGERPGVVSADYVYGDGGFFVTLSRYVVASAGSLVLLRNAEEFREFFAPVETPDEALSFAVALTNRAPFHGFKPPREYRYFTDRLCETYVEIRGSDFIVHNLVQHVDFGCEHPTYLIDYRVARDGSVSEVDRKKVFENPKEDRLCVD